MELSIIANYTTQPTLINKEFISSLSSVKRKTSFLPYKKHTKIEVEDSIYKSSNTSVAKYVSRPK